MTTEKSSKLGPRSKLAIGIVCVALGYFGTREWAAHHYAADYLSHGEIPVYHVMSFHEKALLCGPCAEKAKDVLSGRTERELEQVKHDIENALSGKK